MNRFEGFLPDTFGFYQELAFNNNKAWFELHKEQYQRLVVELAMALITEMQPVLEAISTQYQAVAKKLGGSMMRIYRDVRFSKDKTPYKTNLGIQFRHRQAADVHAPGFYINLAPGDCFIGAGTWHPEPSDLLRIRAALASDPEGFSAALTRSEADSGMVQVGDSAKRPPVGFDPTHPLIQEIKRKDFILSKPLEAEVFLSRDLLSVLSTSFAASSPYMAFLCKALNVPF